MGILTERCGGKKAKGEDGTHDEDGERAEKRRG